MNQVPITNHGATLMFVGNVAIPPGETRIFEAADLPPHLRPEKAPAPLPAEPEDRLLELLDGNVSDIVAAIAERGADGTPMLSDDELIRLGEAEANGKTRKSLMKALNEERVQRANESQDREDLAVFAESLKDMDAEQLDELAKTHQEDPAKAAAVALQQVSNQVQQAVADGDREMLELLREDQPGAVEVPAAVDLIDAALKDLDAD